MKTQKQKEITKIKKRHEKEIPLQREIKRRIGWKIATMIMFAMLLLSIFTGGFSKWEDIPQEKNKGKYFMGRDIFDDKICMLYIEEIDLNILQKDVIIDNNITEPRCESEDYQGHYSPRVYHGKIIY